MTDFIQLNNISKHYGPVQALRNVTFNIRKGEVHALLGENGAGKSTCMRIIRGETAPTQGQLIADGTVVERFSPAVGDELGIAMVHQELAIFDGLSVAENIFPSFLHRTRLGFVDRIKMHAAAKEKLSVFNLSIEPDALLSELTPGQKQIVEILRATSDERHLIILDEPTSSLNSEETATLLALIKKLRDSGRSVLFVSHRIPEVLEISDRITVLRDGAFVDTVQNTSLSEGDLVSKMVGRNVDDLYVARTRTVKKNTPAILTVNGLCGARGVEDIGFELRKGEIIGFFGLDGSGASQLSQMLFGMDTIGAGEILVHGKRVDSVTPHAMIQHGVTYLNSDRSDAGLFKTRSISDGITAPILDRLQSWSLIDSKAVQRLAHQFKDRFAIKAASIASPPASLSGGNQQKVMMAACLTPEPDIVIVNEPTRGVDVGAKVEMHRNLLTLSDSGTGIIVFSSELPELIGLTSRVFVMRSNKIVGELRGADNCEEKIMALAAGGKTLERWMH